MISSSCSFKPKINKYKNQ